ncbi:MAG: YybH family protein, partial [Dehalococcoidia bacterium]
MDIEKYNADWLQAWTEKDADRLVDVYYAPDVVYKDPNTAAGVVGTEALRAYLKGIFAAMPPTTYTPEEIWPHDDGRGYSGRWVGSMTLPEGKARRFRGFDLV